MGFSFSWMSIASRMDFSRSGERFFIKANVQDSGVYNT